MSRRAVVVYCHPCRDSLIAAALQRCVAGLATAGCRHQLLDLYDSGFDSVNARATQPNLVQVHRAALADADAVVFVYPTWYGCQPAMLNGWLTHVFGAEDRWRNIRKLVVVTSHGSGKLTNSGQGEPGKRVMLRGVRVRCHPLVRPKWLALYGVDRDRIDDRLRWLARIEHVMKSI